MRKLWMGIIGGVLVAELGVIGWMGVQLGEKDRYIQNWSVQAGELLKERDEARAENRALRGELRANFQNDDCGLNGAIDHSMAESLRDLNRKGYGCRVEGIVCMGGGWSMTVLGNDRIRMRRGRK